VRKEVSQLHFLILSQILKQWAQAGRPVSLLVGVIDLIQLNAMDKTTRAVKYYAQC
jgi:hypothetical protein